MGPKMGRKMLGDTGADIQQVQEEVGERTERGEETEKQQREGRERLGSQEGGESTVTQRMECPKRDRELRGVTVT